MAPSREENLSRKHVLPCPTSLQPVTAPAEALPEVAFPSELDLRMTEALESWLVRTPSLNTRENYALDVNQFLDFARIPSDHLGRLVQVRPHQVAAWRDALRVQALTNSSIRRKLTALRSFFSFLQTYGYCGANPAHSDFVEAPAVPRDGKTMALSPEDCRRLLNAPDPATPVGVRDGALFAVLAFSACRVGEVVALRVGDFRASGGHKILEVYGKGGKERRVPLHPEAFERLEAWIQVAGIGADAGGPLCRPPLSARGEGKDGFRRQALTRRAVQFLVARNVKKLGLEAAVTVHSFRVTALTTARERGADVIDLQDFAGHADPRTTLTYIRSRDRLSKSPAYVLKY